jgi:hypothetical protein
MDARGGAESPSSYYCPHNPAINDVESYRKIDVADLESSAALGCKICRILDAIATEAEKNSTFEGKGQIELSNRKTGLQVKCLSKDGVAQDRAELFVYEG